MSRDEPRRELAPRLGYRPALDGLRAIAVALVVLSHATAAVPGGGAAGVALFFVLSGFLITTLLLEERADSGIAVASFFVRRALRLTPALFTVLVVVSLGALVSGSADRHDIWTSALFGLTYTADVQIFVLNGVLAEPLGHLWTLSIEEKFYLLWPLVLVWSRRVDDRFVARALIVSVVALEAARWVLIVTESKADADALSWVEALLLGCALGFAFRERRLPTLGHAAVVLGVATLGAVSLLAGGSWYEPAVIASPLLVGATLLVLGSVDGPSAWTRLLSAPGVVWVGRRSYSLYLWHVPVIVVARRTWGSGWPVIVSAVAVSVVLAACSLQVVERPFLRWKHQFERRPIVRHG